MENPFSKYIIKDYKYWTIQIHENQGNLGRCVVWCKRENALDLADATNEEQQELFLVLKDLRRALTQCFNPDWFNYAFLGNITRHLHGHVIPRYASPREFMSMTFEDKLWGKNYKTDYGFVTPGNVLEEVKSQLKKALA